MAPENHSRRNFPVEFILRHIRFVPSISWDDAPIGLGGSVHIARIAARSSSRQRRMLITELPQALGRHPITSTGSCFASQQIGPLDFSVGSKTEISACPGDGPLFPRKRTLELGREMSALCQKRTSTGRHISRNLRTVLLGCQASPVGTIVAVSTIRTTAFSGARVR